jgi:flagellar biosynthesis/type III secretory pathway chaperone
MKNEKVDEVLKSEAELAEVLLGLLKQQQNAIVHFRDSELTTLMEQQQSVLRPLEALERERAHMIHGEQRLLEHDAQAHGNRLKEVAKQIVEVNRQNKALLENSLKFIQQSLRIMTDNYTKQLLDAKI